MIRGQEECDKLRVAQLWADIPGFVVQFKAELSSETNQCTTTDLPAHVFRLICPLLLLKKPDYRMLLHAEFELETFLSFVHAVPESDQAKKFLALAFEGTVLSPGTLVDADVGSERESVLMLATVEKLVQCARLCDTVLLSSKKPAEISVSSRLICLQSEQGDASLRCDCSFKRERQRERERERERERDGERRRERDR
jgi:hypothetical protein